MALTDTIGLGKSTEAGRLPLQLPLFGAVTVCCSCFRLKRGSGKWTRRVVPVLLYPETVFSHGLCPACFKRLYPSEFRNMKSKSSR